MASNPLTSTEVTHHLNNVKNQRLQMKMDPNLESTVQGEDNDWVSVPHHAQLNVPRATHCSKFGESGALLGPGESIDPSPHPRLHVPFGISSSLSVHSGSSALLIFHL